MEVRISKVRVARATLFVLAGVGLGSLLSPLVGTALATVGSIVNISDRSPSAYFAKVDANGALKTNATVTGGNVAIGAPQSAFSFPVLDFADAGPKRQFLATNATLAFTGFRVANGTGATAGLYLYQYPETSTQCDTTSTTGRKFLGAFWVQAGDTVVEQLTTPQVVKPMSGSPYWCLVAFAYGNAGQSFYTTYSGYVVSGSFAPPVTAPPPGSQPPREGVR
jgi:hypothetical protein